VRSGCYRDADLTDAEHCALEFAERATATPPHVDQALVDRLGTWFEPAQIVEMAAIVAWENYRARFNCALGIEGHTFYQPRSG